MIFPPKPPNYLALAMLASGGLLVLSGINQWQWTAWDFRNNLWAPTHLLVHGQSPYLINSLFPVGRAVWFPMMIGLTFPLGWLTEHQATYLWLMTNLAALVSIVHVCIPPKKFSFFLMIITLSAFLLFPATIAHLRLGQCSLIITLLLLFITQSTTPLSHKQIAFLLAVSLTKPQLNLLIVPGVFMAYIHRQGIKQAASLFGWLIIWVILLTIPLFMAHPLWLMGFLAAQQDNPSTWLQPSLFVLLPLNLGSWGLVGWGLLVSLITGLTIWLWLYSPTHTAMLWSLAFTPLITPYVWSWDFVMIAPLWVNTLFSLSSKTKQAVLGLAYLGCWLGMMSIELSADISNHHYWWVSWYMVIVIISLSPPKHHAQVYSI